ncbi:hypothetical protein ZWY2020_018214 [Hordeum vulgare]|nr:hypothetical protein ZWY2020_018214 [Hordeum vulgare]
MAESQISALQSTTVPAKNVDKPVYIARFNVQGSSADYVGFIAAIRNNLANPKHSTHNRPVLPPVLPSVVPNVEPTPSRWFHVELKTRTSTLTIAARADNLYLEGFRSSDGTWWELTKGLIPGATYVGFGGSYGNLLGDSDNLSKLPIGRQQMNDAVDALASRTRADLTSGPKQQEAKEAVATLLLMVHEATRFQSVSGFVATQLQAKDKKSDKITTEMKAQVNGWKELSKALLKTDVKPPAKFTPIEKMGVLTAEQAAATLGILLFVEVPGGMAEAKALELFHASGRN